MASENSDSALIVNNDELKAFIASTLRAISEGIDEASDAALKQGEYGHSTFDMPSGVSFDVAVTARRSNENDKGVKLEVFNIGGGLSGKNSTHSESVSRISFSVPWKFTRTKHQSHSSGLSA